MSRTVDRRHMDKWIDANYPDAITKLAVASKVSANTLNKIRTGYVPKDSEKRKALAGVLGVSEDQLFPEAKGSEAS